MSNFISDGVCVAAIECAVGDLERAMTDSSCDAVIIELGDALGSAKRALEFARAEAAKSVVGMVDGNDDFDEVGP